MENSLEKGVKIGLSMCDNQGRLSVPDTLALFMDIAAEHAEKIGAGFQVMNAGGFFWLTMRTCVRFAKRPPLLRDARIATWPGPMKGPFCHRYYTLQAGDEPLAEGMTEWVIFDVKNKRIARPAPEFAKALPYREETVCEGEKIPISEDFSAGMERGQYTVRSTDIDLGQHMNNVAYVRALMGAFTTRELQSTRISELDVFYRQPCFEGETLKIWERKIEGGLEMGMFRPEGKPAVLARIRFD